MRLLPLALALAACAADGDRLRAPDPGDDGFDNAWYHADEIPEEPGDAALKVGRTAPNLVWVDQHGDNVQLYQFAGQLVFLDVIQDTGTIVTEITGCTS